VIGVSPVSAQSANIAGMEEAARSLSLPSLITGVLSSLLGVGGRLHSLLYACSTAVTLSALLRMKEVSARLAGERDTVSIEWVSGANLMTYRASKKTQSNPMPVPRFGAESARR
jgi:hypothetical protein